MKKSRLNGLTLQKLLGSSRHFNRTTLGLTGWQCRP